MRARLLLTALAAVPLLAACDAAPTAPPSPDDVPAPALALTSACEVNRAFHLDEVVRDFANTTIRLGHVHGPATEHGVMHYQLVVTADMAERVAAGRAEGCLPQFFVRTDADLATLGRGTATFSATATVTIGRPGSWPRTLGRIVESNAKPGCETEVNDIVCPIIRDYTFIIQTPVLAGDVITLRATATGHADPGGTRTADQASASWGLPRGFGLNPYGPKLIARQRTD